MEKKDRAWIEINLDNLEHNIKEIQRILSSKTKIMAVVKANAYGHGMIEISKKLNEIGIRDFAVATLKEAITLKKHHIIGNILVLGYTKIEDIPLILKYDLIQTVIDEEYAKQLLSILSKQKVKVHIKINTGMNRIGIHYHNIEMIKSLYYSHNLQVLGIFSHLCVADSNALEDRNFTQNQIELFNHVVEQLKEAKIEVGKVHLQSSYGLLNYPTLQYDYVRTGIIMYGVHSELNIKMKVSISLKPVLTLKAKVTSVKEIMSNETVGYGRKYKATKKEKIASISIGYADGYPRSISNQGAKVLINKQYAGVIGRICMDQCMIKVTGMNIKVGDTVTIIGNNPNISAEKLAFYAGTITTELLSRLGERLEK